MCKGLSEFPAVKDINSFLYTPPSSSLPVVTKVCPRVPAAGPASLGSFSEMNVLRLHPDLLAQKLWRYSPTAHSLVTPPEDFYAHKILWSSVPYTSHILTWVKVSFPAFLLYTWDNKASTFGGTWHRMDCYFLKFSMTNNDLGVLVKDRF